MKTLNNVPSGRLQTLTADFTRAMRAAGPHLGNDAFRKRYHPNDGRHQISMALFEAWSVQLARCSGEQVDQLVDRQAEVRDRFMALLNGDSEFEKAISISTGASQRIRKRLPRSAIWCRSSRDAAVVLLHEAYLLLLRRGGRARERAAYLLGLSTKIPLLSDTAPQDQDRFLACEAKTSPPEDGAPLVFCAVSDAIAVSVPSEAVWDRDRIPVPFHELLPDGTPG